MNRPKSLVSVTVILVFLLAQVPFSLAEWVAVGKAPEDIGLYEVIIQATYEGITGTLPLELTVDEVEYPLGGLTVEPVYPIAREPPITLKYDITMNGSYAFDMIWNKVNLYYVSGNTLLKSEDMALTKENGNWFTIVNVPFKGDYRAVVSLIVEQGGVKYGGDFVTLFSSDSPSPDLKIDVSLDKRVVIPAESFEVKVDAEFEGSVLPDVEIFRANLYGTLKKLTWDGADRAYLTSFTAPQDEGIYPLNVYADGQDFVNRKKIYVTEIARPKSARCPLVYEELAGCNDMKDVRKCVSDVKAGNIIVSEQALVDCYESASGGITYGAVVCERDAKGDLDGDGHLELDDLELLQNVILPLGQSARADYKDCGDYDLDGDVDEQDLECLTNVVARKWFGNLNGGICVDLVFETPLKCDLDGDSFIKDEDAVLLDQLLDAKSEGIEIDELILDTCDFDQDNSLTQADRNCLGFFLGMDLDNPETLLGQGKTIPSSCMNIYTLNECKGIRGDINGDLVINQVDEILILLIDQKQISGFDMSCADVNEDNRITTEDFVCIRSYTSGDQKTYFVCIGCDENIPEEYRFRAEICNDGYDNDCDGLIDRTSLGVDLCDCTPDTPCWFVQDVDGGTVAGIDDYNLNICRKASWEGSSAVPGGGMGTGYKWYPPTSLVCDSSKECEELLCGGTEFKCAFNGKEWKWYEIGKDNMPIETDEPEDTPKTCEDGFDNDCSAGDEECKEPPSMFASWEFWVGAIIGFVIGWLLGPIYAMILGLLLMVANQFIDEGPLKNFLSGFGIGMAVGGLASGLAGGTEIGTKLGAGSWGKGINNFLGLGGTPPAAQPTTLNPSTPVTPATPATPVTPATPATPLTPRTNGFDPSIYTAGQVV